ncbi:hypothetical protein PCASD_10203 [Puccinia coronata f. sp. avenae]|uniref:Uncharacterized protein n=1 Tax=Puccinia coronata f. sp. avenae TaxID=200324 RepID=A0A2N5UD32_9BASI|nr:hypothetical protein PCASD_10203 [Puccinia coronata f. sp. avenae]
MDINQTQEGTQDSNASIGVPPAAPPSLNKSQDAASSTSQGNRRKRWTKSSLGSQSQSSLRAQTQATRSTNGKSPSATLSNLSGQTQTNQSSPYVSTSTQESSLQFTRSDYEYICFYLEDKENFKQIFGSGSQTLVGGVHLTQRKAFDRFAHYLNLVISDLTLTGSQLSRPQSQHTPQILHSS